MATALLQRQLRRARIRLFLRTLIESSNWCWAAGLLLSAVWFLVQQPLLGPQEEWLRWAVVSGLMLLATVAGFVITALRSPSPLDVALQMDQTFGLKERVTTTLMLDEATSATPAGQALIADVNGRVGNLDMGSGFPIIARQSSWALFGKSLVVPAAATALVLVALLYKPPAAPAVPPSQPLAELKPEEAASAKKNAEDIIKKPAEKKPGEEQRPKSETIKRIDEDLDKLLNKPVQTKEQLKDLAKNLSGMENDLKQKEKDLAAKQAALQQQLKKLDQMDAKNAPKDGPAKEMQKALSEGNLDKARKEAEELAKKLEKGELTEEQKKELSRQVQDMKDKLSELKRQKDEDLKKEKDNLAKQLERGDIDEKTAKEMEKNLDKKSEDSKDLDQLAEQLKECQQCMKDGNSKDAGEKLKQAADKLKQMDGDKKDLQDLQDKLNDLQKAQQCLQPSLQGGNPVPGAGPRPKGTEEPTKSTQNKVDTQMAKDGQKAISDFVTGPAFKKKSTQDIAGDVVQSSQDADTAREQQKVDRNAKDLYKGYFENLRRDAEKDLPKAPNP